jgi:hypothetical protein
MTELGYNIVGVGASEMADMTRTDIARWAPIIKASGARAD